MDVYSEHNGSETKSSDLTLSNLLSSVNTVFVIHILCFKTK